MSNKQGQQTKTGKQESQGNQAHPEETKRAAQQRQGSDSRKEGPQPGSQRDKNRKHG